MSQTNQASNAVAHETEQGCMMLTQPVTATKAGSKTRVKVGEFTVIVPTLSRLMTDLADAKVTGTDDDGLPTYDSNLANWVQRAVNALSKAEARNKLVTGSADLKAGAKIPTTLAELVEPAAGGNTALAELAELARNFGAWIEATGKPAALVSTFGQLVRQPNLIPLQTDKVKQVLSTWLEEFALAAAAADSLTDYQSSHCERCINQATGEQESLDDLLADF